MSVDDRDETLDVLARFGADEKRQVRSSVR
jgi:hypothetical protein